MSEHGSVNIWGFEKRGGPARVCTLCMLYLMSYGLAHGNFATFAEKWLCKAVVVAWSSVEALD